ncbi:c-type cytochrome [Pseudonocardia sp. MH-G8]|uniref:cytochrome bc1 complex diheme cytochrome c subunit n=1 Tax=Pseudonocardia sp. MH-G8 TaxID=1854588 RepID=UPI000BA0CDE1|nr:c-type cytochrome [Pseudonocardia sp. MH-G8]OZM77196.1 cystathionine beta-lyase [Pseudonocardia sp. MH-G8]
MAARTPRSLAALLLLAAVLTGAALVQLGTRGTAAADSPPVVAAQPPADPGRELFLRNCAWCHGQDGAGSQYGPSLVGVGEASADFQLGTGRMPLASEQADPQRGEPAFSPAEIDALVGYVGSLGGGPPVPQLGPGDPVSGRDPYVRNCASCHSSTGTGSVLPGGRHAPDLFAASPTQVAEAVRVGPGQMPQFSQHVVDDRELDDLVAYVQQLGTEQNRGGAALERIGPVAEGFVAFFVAIPLLLIVIRLLGRKAP